MSLEQQPKLYNYRTATILHEEAILGCLYQGPHASKQIARFLHWPQTKVLAILHRMRDAGKLRLNEQGLWEKISA